MEVCPRCQTRSLAAIDNPSNRESYWSCKKCDTTYEQDPKKFAGIGRIINLEGADILPCPRCVAEPSDVMCPECWAKHKADHPMLSLDPTELMGTGLQAPIDLDPEVIYKRMDTFSRAITTPVDGLDHVAYAKWAVNEFDKFFNTGLQVDEPNAELEVPPSSVRYKIFPETLEQGPEDLWHMNGWIIVTEGDGKETVVKDMPVIAQGFDEITANNNFSAAGQAVINQLKNEGRFE